MDLNICRPLTSLQRICATLFADARKTLLSVYFCYQLLPVYFWEMYSVPERIAVNAAQGGNSNNKELECLIPKQGTCTQQQHSSSTWHMGPNRPKYSYTSTNNSKQGWPILGLARRKTKPLNETTFLTSQDKGKQNVKPMLSHRTLNTLFTQEYNILGCTTSENANNHYMCQGHKQNRQSYT